MGGFPGRHRNTRNTANGRRAGDTTNANNVTNGESMRNNKKCKMSAGGGARPETNTYLHRAAKTSWAAHVFDIA